MTVDSDRLDLYWSGAAGIDDRESEEAIAPDQPLRLASTTKTYVAAAILRLAEQGKLGLDDPLHRHLPKHQRVMLTKGNYDLHKITVRHLLTHTAGVRDHALNDDYFHVIKTDPMHRWTREEQIQFAMDLGGPYGLPGEYYHYSDTGYILLGEIVEQRSGTGMAQALRSLLRFDALGLGATWLETMEHKPDGAPPRAHQYWGDTDTIGWHASLDLYGGGGLVASMPDLARFFRALFQGEIFEGPQTLQTMRTNVVPDRGGPWHQKGGYGDYQYCMGIYVTQYRDYTVYQHAGFWGTRGAYLPALDLAMGVAVTQQESREQQKELFESVLDVVIDSKTSE